MSAKNSLPRKVYQIPFEDKSTPGPWMVAEGLDIIAQPQLSPVPHGRDYIDVATCGTSIVEFLETAEANAHLIAAAPTLRAALYRMLLAYAGIDELCPECGEQIGSDESCESCNVIGSAMDAINKSRGRQ